MWRLTDEGGLLTDLIRHALQTALEVEMADHLGYELETPTSARRGPARRLQIETQPNRRLPRPGIRPAGIRGYRRHAARISGWFSRGMLAGRRRSRATPTASATYPLTLASRPGA
jgi:hypothetical protein